jgi:hypothetical protein
MTNIAGGARMRLLAVAEASVIVRHDLVLVHENLAAWHNSRIGSTRVESAFGWGSGSGVGVRVRGRVTDKVTVRVREHRNCEQDRDRLTWY